MHNKDKYPEIWTAFSRAKERKATLMAERKIHTDAMDALQVDIDAVKEKRAEISKLAYKDIDELKEVSREISRMARAMGANSIAAPS